MGSNELLHGEISTSFCRKGFPKGRIIGNLVFRTVKFTSEVLPVYRFRQVNLLEHAWPCVMCAVNLDGLD